MSEALLNFEQSLALDLYLKWRFCNSDFRPPLPPTPEPTESEMAPDPNGWWYRREDGSFGDYYSEIIRPRERRQEGRAITGTAVGGQVFWNNGGGAEFRAARPTEQTEEEAPLPPLPEVERFSLLTTNNQQSLRACKKWAAELVKELFAP